MIEKKNLTDDGMAVKNEDQMQKERDQHEIAGGG